MIWLKIESRNSKPIFIASCYLPPENSIFYTRNDIDIFHELEDSVSKYMKYGSVYVTGDLNSRCGKREDFIDNDILHDVVVDEIQPLLDYTPDTDSNDRNSSDIYVNQFGRRLLTMCKSTGLRIVNGRHKDDPNGDITYYGANGCSMIDYLLTDRFCMSNVVSFSTGHFNVYSDHAPLSFSLLIPNFANICNMEQQYASADQLCRGYCNSVKWIDENNDQIVDVLRDNLMSLDSCLNSTFNSQENVDTAVNSFSTTLRDIDLPHCKVTRVQSCKGEHHKMNLNVCNKPWFTDDCKTKYYDYKSALRNFNSCKSDDNRRVLIHRKGIYKKLARKLKRQYQRQQGNTLEYLRKHNPKQFYKHFSKKKSLEGDPAEDTDTLTAVFEELDAPITFLEIEKAIGRLKTGKSCVEDNLVNEIFIKCREILTPTLHTLFNSVFSSGYFPEAWAKAALFLF